jgi:S1-C subfamily serine protease
VPTGPLAADHATAVALGGGRVLTVAHALRAGRPVFAGGRRARVVSVDRRLDLAVLAVPGLRAPAAARGEARAGERVTVRALRGALPAVVRRVITANVDGRVRPALELSAAVQPGDSGAPVVDGGGRMLGVVFAGADGGLAYAVRTDRAPSPPPGRPARAG